MGVSPFIFYKKNKNIFKSRETIARKKTTERTKTGKNLLKKLFSRGYNRILFSLFIKRNGINRRFLETAVARRRFGHAEIHFRGFCCAEISIGPGTLNFIKRVFEHSVMSFFSI